MAENYEDLLDRQWSDIPEVSILPVGSWGLKGVNVFHKKALRAEEKERLLFFYAAETPMDDVDEDELRNLGADYDFGQNRIVSTFWLENGLNPSRDMDTVRAHLKKHGIDLGVLSLRESFEEFKGSEVVAYLGTQTYTTNSGEQKTDNIPSAFSPVDA